MKIAIAADHAGYEEKEQLKLLLDELGISYADLGTGIDCVCRLSRLRA
jgi:ribose 5-phosphate isomerase RpiB